jgi:cytochrome c oxidase subunit 2
MRILLAKLFVAITALLIVVLAVVFATLRRVPDRAQAPPPRTPEPENTRIERGRAVFIAQRCQRCHSLHGEGNKRSPLDGVGGRLSEKDIRLWITDPQTMKPGIAKRAYKLSAEDLDALVEYLRASEL